MALAACSSQSATTSPPSESHSWLSASSGSAAPGSPTWGSAQVTVDGHAHDITGVRCRSKEGSVIIDIGDDNLSTGAMVTEGRAPRVEVVSIDKSIGGGKSNLYLVSKLDEATAQKNGNSYTICGQVDDVDAAADSTKPVTRPFEMKFSCPW
ncbi:lipoprotein LpqH [Mycobacterium sp. 3519A]|uniref:lipoprotein LpqH n=1 Tax=Mycobacterium sp. 3519A TaxID=2057184 RepID=UPI001F45F9D0|nr:lipoprotein LpqH [Mycobacterium sp. 3519A]